MTNTDSILLEIKDAIGDLIADRRSDRLSHLLGQALLSLVVLSMAVIGVAVVVAEDADRTALEEKLCSEVLETRHVLIESFNRYLEASKSGKTGLTGDAQAQEIARLESTIARLESTGCD